MIEDAAGPAAPRSTSEMTGQVLGNYRLIREIGRGGMATVYLAEQQSMGREVALKVLPREFLHDPAFMERFRREVKLIAALEHPHVLPVYDFGEVRGVPYIVMRYMEGGTLRHWLRQGVPPLLALERPMRQVCEALDFAHEEGIIHRDLKPTNVMLDGHGNAYLADFGIAHITKDGGALTGSAIIGTPAYMSPEQALGTPIDRRSDVYSLGVLLFEMTTGRQPFVADSPLGVIIKQIQDDVPSPSTINPNLPQSVCDVVLRATRKEPEDRYESVLEVLADFSKALREMTTTTSSPPPMPAQLFQPDQTTPTKPIAAVDPVDGTIVGHLPEDVEITRLLHHPVPDVPPPFDLKAAADHFNDAYRRQDWQTAMHWLRQIRRSGEAMRFHRLTEYENEIAAHLKKERKQHEHHRRRESLMKHDYEELRDLAARDPDTAWRALREFWDFFGNYDPNNLLVTLDPARRMSAEQRRLLALISDPDTRPAERITAGRDLNRHGDPRLGVGLTPKGMPDLDWVEIPEGEFTYGSGKVVYLPAYAISRYPITYAQYEAFIQRDHGRTVELPFWNDPDLHLGNHPVVGVMWHDAMSFARWLGTILSLGQGESIRLPTEQEWEKAARGVDERAYPWGSACSNRYGNFKEGSITRLLGRGVRTTAVGIYPEGISPYGVHDMAGNVWEWCMNDYNNPQNIQPGQNVVRAVRGGSWDTDCRQAQTTTRTAQRQEARSSQVGFRVVRVQALY